MTTKADWIRNTAIIFKNAVPTHQLSDAEDKVSTYLTNVAGGWASTESGDPDGNGAPVSGQGEPQAAEALIAVEFENTKTLTYTFKVRVTAKQTGTFPTGTTQTAMVTSIRPEIEERIIDLLAGEGFEYVAMDYAGATTSVRTTGILTAANRVDIQTEIATKPNLTDPCAIATNFVRENYDKNTTWMAEKLYKRDQYPIVVFVRKYTNSTYAALDLSYVDGANTVTNEGYILYVDDATLQVQTCLISPPKTVV